MSGLPHVRSFRELREETYALTDQVRRASRSIGGQIAEAWAKRMPTQNNWRRSTGSLLRPPAVTWNEKKKGYCGLSPH